MVVDQTQINIKLKSWNRLETDFPAFSENVHFNFSEIAYFIGLKFYIFIKHLDSVTSLKHRQIMSTVTWIGRWLANYLQYFDNFISELEMQTKSDSAKVFGGDRSIGT